MDDEHVVEGIGLRVERGKVGDTGRRQSARDGWGLRL